MSCSVRNMVRACMALGLEADIRKTCEIYKGYANGKYCRIVIHKHSAGKDIATGTYDTYIKELGFKSDKEFKEFLDRI